MTESTAQTIRYSIDRLREQLDALPQDAEHADQRRELHDQLAALTQDWWYAQRNDKRPAPGKEQGRCR